MGDLKIIALIAAVFCLMAPVSYADTGEDVGKIAAKDFSYIADDQTLEALNSEARQGNTRSQYELARQYERIKKQATRQDITDVQIVELYERSAQAGYVPSQFVLGLMFAKGNYVGKDSVSAYKWLYMAAQQGDSMSQDMLTALESTMTPQQIDQAIKLAGD